MRGRPNVDEYQIGQSAQKLCTRVNSMMSTKITDIVLTSLTKLKNSRKVSSLDSSPKEKVMSIFGTIEVLCRLAGLCLDEISVQKNTRCSSRALLSILVSINGYAFFLCAWINQLRLIPILVKEGDYSPAMMLTLLLFFAYLASSWGVTCWMLLFRKTHFENITRVIQSVVSEQRHSCLFQHFNVFVVLSCSIGLLFPIYSLLSLFENRHSLMTKIRLFPAEDDTHFWNFMKGFYAYFAVMAYMQAISYSVFLFVVCSFLKREFQNVSDKLTDMVKNQDQTWLVGDLEDLRLRHKDVCNATGVADGILRFIVFGVYVTGILIACFCVSCLTHGSFPTSELPTLAAVAFASFGQVLLTSLLGAMLNHQAHRPHEILTRIKTGFLTKGDYRSLLVFLTQVTGSNIGITAIGMFTVNKPAILTILGTIITYAVIIQQLNVSPGADLNNLINTTVRSDPVSTTA